MADPEDDTDFAKVLNPGIERATAHIDALRTRNRDLAGQLYDLQKSATEARYAQFTLQKQYDDSEKKRDQLRNEATTHRDTLRPIIEENHSLKDERDQLLAKLKEATEAKERLRDGNEAYREDIKDLEGQKEQAQEENDTITQQLVAKKNEVYDADQTIKDLRSVKSSLQLTVELKDKAIDDLVREKDTLQRECGSLHSQENVLRTDLLKGTDKVKAAEAEQAKLSKACAIHQAEIKNLKGELSKKNFQSNVISTNHDKIRELNDSIRELRQELEAEKSKGTRQIDLLATRNVKIQELNEFKDGAERRLRAVEATCQDLKLQRDTLADQLGQSQESNLETNAINVGNAKGSHFEKLLPEGDGRRFDADSTTFAEGKGPDHGSSLRRLWANLNDDWTTREGVDLLYHSWNLTSPDLLELSSEVVSRNIRYQDLPKEGRMTNEEQEASAAQLAEVH